MVRPGWKHTLSVMQSLIALARAEASTYNYLMHRDNQSSRGISQELADRLVGAVRAEQVANEIVDEQVTEFLGINRTDSRCLDIVERHGRMTAGALAEESGLTTGAVTALVDRLERAGYLHRIRDTADRRKVFIELTPLMTRITEKLFYNMDGMFKGMMERLTPTEVEAITFFLKAGIFINAQRARLLKEHLPAGMATAEERLAAASAYDKAARKAAPAITERLRGEDFGRD
jgi:DNA-binding MarR family transcriptional regulator